MHHTEIEKAISNQKANSMIQLCRIGASEQIPAEFTGKQLQIYLRSKPRQRDGMGAILKSSN